MNPQFVEKLNQHGALKEPCFFMISYDLQQFELFALSDLPSDIEFKISDEPHKKSAQQIRLQKAPLSFEAYKQKFDAVQKHIRAGNSYLLNLTLPTKISCTHSLQAIYEKAQAKFKLKYKEQFVCFSPERFVQIKDNTIATFPMKGTIDANIANAKHSILANEKEMAEHTMVVDLLRNDLSIVASKVKVEKFRYIDKIEAGQKKLLQVSSKITGELNDNWHEHLGELLIKILPAGSITGTPKKKTVELLQEIEQYERGYYTGVFGVYDGKSLDSAVMIRFIQKDKQGQLLYKSGGGITCDSDASSEYQELIDKIYIPS